MFGLGAQEVAVLLIFGVLLFGFPLVVLVTVLVLTRRRGAYRVAELEAEVARLREQLDRKP